MSILKCPVCQQIIRKEENRYVCTNRHSFDIAKQGYSNLLLKQSSKVHGDNKDMLLARKEIQAKGIYAHIAMKIIDILSTINHQKILDIGCGTGYYTSLMQEAFTNEMYGVDISKEALKIAANGNKDITYLVASNKDLPLVDSSMDVVTNVFSPLYVDEVKRVLKDNGYVLVVSSNENHLIELKEIIYDTIIKKEETRNHITNDHLLEILDVNVIEHILLDKTDLHNLFMMTPHYWTSSVSGKERLNHVRSLQVQLDINFKLYKKV